MKRAIILPALVTAFVALSPVGIALADNPHTTPGSTGQPNKEASEDPALKPPGFSTGETGTVNEGKGFANAETHYAGSDGTPSANHTMGTPGHDHAVSQYDVAGFQWEQHH
jgi:hypothetical protein